MKLLKRIGCKHKESVIHITDEYEHLTYWLRGEYRCQRCNKLLNKVFANRDGMYVIKKTLLDHLR